MLSIFLATSSSPQGISKSFERYQHNVLYVNRRLYEVAYPILYDNVVTYHISHRIKSSLVDGNHKLFLHRLAKAKRGPDGNGLLKKLLISIEPFYFYDDIKCLPTNDYISRMILRACKGFHEYQTCFDKVTLRVQSAKPEGCPGLQVLHLEYLFGLGYLHCKSVSHNWIGKCAIKSQLQWCFSHPVFVRPLALINMALWRFICKYTGHPALGNNGADWSLRAWFISRTKSASMDVDAKTYCLVADMTIDYVIMMAETGRCGAKHKCDAKGGVMQKVAKKLKKEINQVKALMTDSTS